MASCASARGSCSRISRLRSPSSARRCKSHLRLTTRDESQAPRGHHAGFVTVNARPNDYERTTLSLAPCGPHKVAQPRRGEHTLGFRMGMPNVGIRFPGSRSTVGFRFTLFRSGESTCSRVSAPRCNHAGFVTVNARPNHYERTTLSVALCRPHKVAQAPPAPSTPSGLN